MSKCVRCRFEFTWAEQRRSYARVIKRGVKPEEATRLGFVGRGFG